VNPYAVSSEIGDSYSAPIEIVLILTEAIYSRISEIRVID
jgi:hypothetical protein